MTPSPTTSCVRLQFSCFKVVQIPDSMFRTPREAAPVVEETAAAAGDEAADAPSADELSSIALSRLMQMVRCSCSMH